MLYPGFPASPADHDPPDQWWGLFCPKEAPNWGMNNAKRTPEEHVSTNVAWCWVTLRICVEHDETISSSLKIGWWTSTCEVVFSTCFMMAWRLQSVCLSCCHNFQWWLADLEDLQFEVIQWLAGSVDVEDFMGGFNHSSHGMFGATLTLDAKRLLPGRHLLRTSLRTGESTGSIPVGQNSGSSGPTKLLSCLVWKRMDWSKEV